MCKFPQAGRTKTRLGKEIGMGRAANLFRLMTRKVISTALQVQLENPSLHIVLAVDPAFRINEPISCWIGANRRIAQTGGDLGRRMTNAIKEVQKSGGEGVGFRQHRGSGQIFKSKNKMRRQHLLGGVRGTYKINPSRQGSFILIGCDAPQMTKHHLHSALAALTSHDVVIGPAEDGGYWLIGGPNPNIVAGLFSSVRWSSKHTLKDTIKNCPKGSHIATIETLRDIDEIQDFKMVGFKCLARTYRA